MQRSPRIHCQLLSEIQINHLINHREQNGYLMTIYELQSIEGFDVSTIKKILPYVYVSDYFNSSFFNANEMLKYGKHEYVMRLQRIIEKQSGYMKPDSATKATKPNSYYLGDPNRIFARYHFQYSNAVSVAFSGEKDAGEEFFKGTQKKGFDFYSGHIGIKNIKPFIFEILLFENIIIPTNKIIKLHDIIPRKEKIGFPLNSSKCSFSISFLFVSFERDLS